MAERASFFAVVGVCLYLVGIAAPWEPATDIPLAVLALLSLVAVIFRAGNRTVTGDRITPAVFFFVASLVISAVLSTQSRRSLELSAPMLPGILIFLVVSRLFGKMQDFHWLYVTLTVEGLALGAWLAWIALTHPGSQPAVWMQTARLPLLLVPNDVTWLCLIAPFGLMRFLHKPRSVTGIVSLASLALTLAVACVFQSRGAILALASSVFFGVALCRPRFALKSTALVLLLTLFIDGLGGFPAISRVFNRWTWTQRLPLWICAGKMFLEAPLFGQGPHLFGARYQIYRSSMVLPEWITTDPRFTPWAHNLYLEVLAEQGAVGLTALLALLGFSISQAWRLRQHEVEEVRLLSNSVLAALLSFCFSAAIELTLLRLWVVVLLFVLLGTIARLSSTTPIKEDFT